MLQTVTGKPKRLDLNLIAIACKEQLILIRLASANLILLQSNIITNNISIFFIIFNWNIIGWF